MNDNFRCGDPEVLIAYLYDEGEPSEREAVALHVARCAACTDEIESLRETRALLGAWTPPAAALGFRITQTEAPAASLTGAERGQADKVLRPAVWWRRPLPAWAQAAAALLIFAAGLTIGGARESAVVQPVATTAPAAPAAFAAPQAVPVLSREDLARLEERVRTLESARVSTAAARPPARAVDEAALLRRVEALIASSEDRQHESISVLVDALNRLDRQQRGDMQQVANRFIAVHDTTQRELTRQNNALAVLTTLTTSAVK
jgi:hypothetical protein